MNWSSEGSFDGNAKLKGPNIPLSEVLETAGCMKTGAQQNPVTERQAESQPCRTDSRGRG